MVLSHSSKKLYSRYYLNCLHQMSLFTRFAFLSYPPNLFPVPSCLGADCRPLPLVSHNLSSLPTTSKPRLKLKSVQSGLKHFNDEQMYIFLSKSESGVLELSLNLMYVGGYNLNWEIKSSSYRYSNLSGVELMLFSSVHWIKLLSVHHSFSFSLGSCSSSTRKLWILVPHLAANYFGIS